MKKDLIVGLVAFVTTIVLGFEWSLGWDIVPASLIDLFGRVDAKAVLEVERERLHTELTRAQVGGERVGA